MKSEKGPCPNCTSSDAFALYEDGHGYCFSCGYHLPASGAKEPPAVSTSFDLVPRQQMQYTDIDARGIKAGACRTFDYMVAPSGNHFANVYDESLAEVVGQKVRKANKEFTTLGTCDTLIGQHAWEPDECSMIVICEGEFDALSYIMAEVPAVSLVNGANSVGKALKQKGWLEQFDRIVLSLDADEVGQQAAAELAAGLDVCKLWQVDLEGCKDANDYLLKHGPRLLKARAFAATRIMPEGVTDFDLGQAFEMPEWGSNWPWPKLTQATYGRRKGELYVVGAGTGVGKTTFAGALVGTDVWNCRHTTGVYMLEDSVERGRAKIGGALVGYPLHLPPEDALAWQVKANEAAHKLEEAKGLLYFYDDSAAHGGPWQSVKRAMIYQHDVFGVTHFIIDNLTCLVGSDDEDERRAIFNVMRDLAKLVKDLDICVLAFSHFARQQQKVGHEEGAVTRLQHLYGSSAIEKYAHFCFGLERNTLSDDEEVRNTTTIRVLKDRFSGRATGKTIELLYNKDTGQMAEKPLDDGF